MWTENATRSVEAILSSLSLISRNGGSRHPKILRAAARAVVTRSTSPDKIVDVLVVAHPSWFRLPSRPLEQESEAPFLLEMSSEGIDMPTLQQEENGLHPR
ncbi:hypothetical protein EDD16DRAFT_1517677 [Pisolithus croceorrhizus]|nr:hypothetical protein EDD16DRAFT_1517677 [Pisolithus croceorrhizus]